MVPSAVLICFYFLNHSIEGVNTYPEMSTCYFENDLLLSSGEITVSQNYDPKGLLAHTQIGTETN